MKTINAKKLNDRMLNEYMRHKDTRFCLECRNLTPIMEMYVQYYVNGLYGYTCLPCANPKT